MIRKSYNIGETVWIYGIYVRNDVPVQGKIIHKFNLNYKGFDPIIEHYVIAVESHIEPLIETRTWETISQDEYGPVGGLRGLEDTTDRKVLIRTGFDFKSTGDTFPNLNQFELSDYEGDPTPEQIHAAMERSKQISVIPPLVIKENKSTPRRYNRKRKP
jgi:hypothetical protein